MSKNSRKRFLCIDCHVDTGAIYEHYYINLETWLSVVGSKTGMLCIGCLEKRLGRKLNKVDFTDCTLNNPKFTKQSIRLSNRLQQ